MSSVKSFYDNLSNVQKDIFYSAVSGLQASATNEKIERLDVFHKQLKQEIDQINRKREALCTQSNDIELVLKLLNQYDNMENNCLELTMFRGMLQKVLYDLRVEVDTLKPEKKLAKKFEVARRKESLIQRQKLAEHLIMDVLKMGDTNVSDTNCKRSQLDNPYIETLAPKDLGEYESVVEAEGVIEKSVTPERCVEGLDG